MAVKAKRGRKKKSTQTKSRKSTVTDCNSSQDEPYIATPLDLQIWPGWVEMESEPAFFNVMLKDMGVQGVQVMEVYSLDAELLALLPQPVHALIFLFRYHETGNDEPESDYADDVWFARQVPEFACATVALLNIVNNIPDLDLGERLQAFKDSTQDMDPLERGRSIDQFQFVRSIHNSFARETDLHVADMHIKGKAAKARRQKAAAKAKAVKAEKARQKAGVHDVDDTDKTTPGEATPREKRSAEQDLEATLDPGPKKSEAADADGTESKDQSSSPRKTKRRKAETKPDEAYEEPAASDEPPVNGENLRRSTRKPKARKNVQAVKDTDGDEEEGFHFCAYMPINGHVWKLDGLDHAPQDMGVYDAELGETWMDIAQPLLQSLMAGSEVGAIEFNLMAVAHDPLIANKRSLAESAKAILAVERKLGDIAEDWMEVGALEGREDAITDTNDEFAFTQADIMDAEISQPVQTDIDNAETLEQLLDLRRELVAQQAPIRGTLRDELRTAQSDQENARLHRHDYGHFIREWMGALAAQGILNDLVEGV